MSPSTSSLIFVSLLLTIATTVQSDSFCSSYSRSRRAGKDSCNIQCFVADPVCGANGVTYGCGCPEASCHGVRVVKKGPCTSPPSDEICGSGTKVGSDCEAIRCLVADPVCGVNGVTYTCGCVEADCYGMAVVHTGECKSES